MWLKKPLQINIPNENNTCYAGFAAKHKLWQVLPQAVLKPGAVKGAGACRAQTAGVNKGYFGAAAAIVGIV